MRWKLGTVNKKLYEQHSGF